MSRDRSCRSLPLRKGSREVFGLGFLLTDPFPGHPPSGDLSVRHPYRCASAPASHRVPWPASQLVTDSVLMVRHGDGVECDQVATHDVVLLRRGDVTIGLNHRNEMVSRGCTPNPAKSSLPVPPTASAGLCRSSRSQAAPMGRWAESPVSDSLL